MHSPYYKGSKLGNSLEKDIQFSYSESQFKQHVKKLYSAYVDDFVI